MDYQDEIKPNFNEKILNMDQKKERKKSLLTLFLLIATFVVLVVVFLKYMLYPPEWFWACIWLAYIVVLVCFVNSAFNSVELDSPLSVEETRQIKDAMKYYPEINEYIQSRMNENKLLTKRDYHYLNIEGIQDRVLDLEAIKKINKFSSVTPLAQDLLSKELDEYPVSEKPFTIKEDKAAKSRKRKLAMCVIALSIATFYIAVVKASPLASHMGLALAMLLIITLIAIPLLSVAVIFTPRESSDLNKLTAVSYSNIEELCKFDVGVVQYLKQVSDQGRVLYTKDYYAMNLDKKLEVMQKYSSTKNLQEAILNNGKN